MGEAPSRTLRVSLLVLVAGPAFAAPVEGETPTREPSIEELLALPVVTSAVRARPAHDAPGTVYVVTAETIRRRGYRHLGELLAEVPEIEIQDQASPDKGDLVTIRGLMGNQRFILLLDGVRIGPPDGTPWVVGENYPLVGLRQVEVMVGPASAVYGADAFTGVIQLISEHGGAIDGVRVGATAGSFGERGATLVAGTRAGPVQLAATAVVTHTDGVYLPDVDPFAFSWYTDHYVPDGLMLAGPTTQEGVEVAVLPWSNRRDAFFVHVRAEVGGFTMGVVASGEHHPSATGTRPEYSLYTEEARYGAGFRSLYGVHEATFGADRVRWRTTADLTDFTMDPDSAFLNAFSNYTKGYKYGSAMAGRGESRATWQITRGVGASMGVRAEVQRGLAKTADLDHPFDPTLPAAAQGFVYAGSDVVAVDGRSLAVPEQFYEVASTNLGAFAEVELHPTDTLSVTGGVRVDRGWGDRVAVDPRAAVILHPLPGSSLKFLYGEAFLAPSSYASYQHFGSFTAVTDAEGAAVGLEGGVWHLPNPSLAPEKLRTYEVDAAVPIGPVLLFGGDAWVTRVDDLMVTRTSVGETWAGWPVDAVQRTVNQGRAWTYGATARGEARLVAGPWTFSPSAAYTYVGGELAGQPLAYAAPHTGKGGVDVSWGQLSAGARAVFRGRTLHPDAASGIDPSAVAPPSTTLDLHLRWAPGLAGSPVGAAVNLDVLNALDTRRYDVGDTYADSLRLVPQAPRSVRVGLEMRI